MAISVNAIEEPVLKCVQRVRQHLISNTVRDEEVGRNPYGDVSKYFDVEAEDMLVDCILNNVRDAVIISEERGVELHGNGRWVVMVDPIDGSTNYESDIPWSAISVVVGVNRGSGSRLSDAVLALVAELARDRIYLYRDGEVRIIGKQVVRKKTPKKVVLGYFDSAKTFKPIELYLALHGGSKVLRVLGSASLDILSVALGGAEVFIDVRNKLRNFDIAAALRIALSLGAKAYVFGHEDPLSIPIDSVVRVSCIVAYDEKYLAKTLEILNQIRDPY